MSPGLVSTPSGARAVVHAPQADLIELCLFDSEGGEKRLALEPSGGHHVLDLRSLPPGQQYGFRAHGPWAPDKGLWHHPDLLLVDPFARAISGQFVDHPSVHHDPKRQDSAPWVPRSVFVESPTRPRPGPGVPWSDTVIYETHVRGLTITHPDVAPDMRGTFLGAGVKTVVLFFEKGAPTRRIWYYQLDPGRNLGKTNPLNDDDLQEFVELQKTFADSENSWTIDIGDVDTASYDLSVKNPNRNDEVVLRDPQEILDEIAELDAETAGILDEIRGMV